jgi:hypothetical protein
LEGVLKFLSDISFNHEKVPPKGKTGPGIKAGFFIRAVSSKRSPIVLFGPAQFAPAGRRRELYNFRIGFGKI